MSKVAGEQFGAETLNDLNRSDMILSNRYEKSIDDIPEKVYKRDIFGRD